MKLMRKQALLAAAVTLTSASAAMAADLVVVSWGGAYTASQQKAYHEPYMAATPGITIINDDSANEAVAKLRAMSEAGNVTWDLVDMVASDAILSCDEGLVVEVDHDSLLAPAPDGTSATQDFGDLIVSPCFIPQIVYSTTFGYRTDLVGDTPPSVITDVFDLEKYPGKRSLEKKPINNFEWALLADGIPADQVYELSPPTKASSARWRNSTRSRTRRCGGSEARKRRSCWPTARSSWAPPTTAVCSRSSRKKSSPSR